LTTLPDAPSRDQSDQGGMAALARHGGRAVGVESVAVVALGDGAESFGRIVDSPDRVTKVILMTDLEAANAHSVAAEAGLAQQSR
jgi:hypothetical protein